MALIKTTAEIKEYLVTDANFNPDSILPYIPLAEMELIRVLGQAQYDELHDYYQSGGSGIPELTALLPFVQRPLVFLAFLQGIDMLNVVITNNGIGVVSTTNLAPASKDRVQALKKSITDNAWDNIEALLAFLETYIDDYPAWESSDAFTYQYEYLINSATKFNEFVPINRSRVTFLKLRPSMADAELLKIAPQISPELMQEIKDQIKSGSVSDDNAAILPNLQRSLAYFSYSTEYKSMEHQNMAITYIMEVKKVIDASPDNYPAYRDSDVYNETLESYQTFENDENSKLVMF